MRSRAPWLLAALVVASFIILLALAVASAQALAKNTAQYVGCSNPLQAVGGYRTVSTVDAFRRTYDTNGGTVERWADPTNVLWERFDAELAAHVSKYGKPMDVIWFQLCVVKARPVTDQDARDVVTLIRQRLPVATIYVSPLGEPCDKADLPYGRYLTDLLVNEGLVLRGPVFVPLKPSEVRADNCHPNAEGKLVLGQQMADFFDPL